MGVLGPLLELRDELGTGKVGAGGGRGAGARVGAEAAVAAVDRWLTPVMSGFLQVERGCRAGERSFDVMFVSRRSRLRQGTRYTRRGIDDGGNVANFVETEQVRDCAGDPQQWSRQEVFRPGARRAGGGWRQGRTNGEERKMQESLRKGFGGAPPWPR